MKNKLFLILSVFSASQAVKPLTLEQEFYSLDDALEDKDYTTVKKIVEEIDPKAVNSMYEPFSSYITWATTLFYAIQIQNKELIQSLIDHGADINYFDGTYTPLTYAITKNYPDIVLLLLKNGADPNLVPTPYVQEDDNDYNAIDGKTPLEVAAYLGNLDMAKLLLNHGAYVGFQSRFTSPLLEAIKSDVEDKNVLNQLIELFLKKGADPNLKVFGSLPLNEAVKREYIEAIKFLLKYGANPNLFADYFGPALIGLFQEVNALMIAVDKDNIKIIKLLLENREHTANPALRNKAGYNTLNLAYQDMSIRKLLEEHQTGGSA